MKPFLTRLAVSDGADCPRLEFLILTKLLCSFEPIIKKQIIIIIGTRDIVVGEFWI